MTSDPDLSRRVSRLEHEVIAIYDLIRDETSEIRGTLRSHDATLQQHSRTLDEHTRILDEHTRILDEHTRILEHHSYLHEQHTRRFDKIDATLVEVLRRLPEPI